MELRPMTTMGGAIKVTGELLREVLHLPQDAKILKIVPSRYADYCFDVVFFSSDGYEIGEGDTFPLVHRGNVNVEGE